MKMVKKISRWIHKYFGLVFLLFLLWMSITGVVLNHPELLRDISVSAKILPKIYQPNNWNRSSFKGVVKVNNSADTLLVYGRQGIYLSTNKGNTIQSFMQGDFPKSAWRMRTNHMVCLENVFFAATNNGLYICNNKNEKWHKNKSLKSKELLKIVPLAKRILVVTKSDFWISKPDNIFEFKRWLPAKKTQAKTVSLVKVFFELHDGSIFGMPGKILWDIAGVVLIFLCVSAFYIWYYPKKWKLQHKRKRKSTAKQDKDKRSFFFKYHKKLGWYFALILVIIVFTGMFMRPPLIMALASGEIPAKYYPKSANVWKHRIRNAFFDTAEEKIILDCSDGTWSGAFEGNKPFEKLNIDLPIFAMGATVFREERPNVWLIGSFGGLYRYFTKSKKIEAVLKVKPRKTSGRPGSVMVTAFVNWNDTTQYVFGHYKGLCNLKGIPQTTIKMPETLVENFKIPLWNFFFEIHNARIFKAFIGSWYILIIPLGGLLCLLVLLSGIYDYLVSKPKKKQNNKRR